MPKASMNKDYFPQAGQHNVRLSWEIAAMQPEAISHGMQKLTNLNFYSRVDTFYTTHDCASLLRREFVRHPFSNILCNMYVFGNSAPSVFVKRLASAQVIRA